MVAGPVQSFTKEDIKARWTERYTSDAINKKFVGIPRGCYLGFIPSPVGLSLFLRPDKVITFSGLSGSFLEGELLTGGSSGATAVVRVISLTYVLIDSIFGGPFTDGETISTTSGTATLASFVEEDVSLARVVSSSPLAGGRSEHMIDVVTSDTVELDFTGFGDGVYYVILTATYEVGQTTLGSIITRTTPPPSGPQEVLVCVATKVGVALTVAATTPATRHEPHAFEGARIGFMPGGSVESLLEATATSAEVIASRQLSDGATTPVFNPVSPQTTGLPLRLNTDLANVAMGGRLGKRVSSVQGNEFTLAGPVSSANVSGSFSSRNRDFEPYKDASPSTGIGIPPGINPAIEATGSDAVELTLSGVVGSFTAGLYVTGDTSGATAIVKSVIGSVMTVSDFVGSLFPGEGITQIAPAATATISTIDLLEGAVTGLTGTTTGNNVCAIVDATTGNKATDPAGEWVFGRLVYGPGGASNPGELTLTAGQQLNFTASTTTVLVTAGSIATPGDIDVGDLVEGADGRFYEVASVVGSPNISSFNTPVAKDYVGPTAVGVGGRRRRRFILEFKSTVSGSEVAATLPAGTYKFYFPAWFTLEKSNLNESLPALVAGEPGQVYGNASTVIGAANTVRRPRIEIANGTAISVQVADNGDRLTFTITNTAPATGGGAAPIGAAGGDLAGSTYPDPIVATVGGITAAQVVSRDTMAVHGIALAGDGPFVFSNVLTPKLLLVWAICVDNTPNGSTGIAFGSLVGEQAYMHNNGVINGKIITSVNQQSLWEVTNWSPATITKVQGAGNTINNGIAVCIGNNF